MKISYELAKELKENGFPQGLVSYSKWSNGVSAFWIENVDPLTRGRYDIDNAVKFPTLSELIDACGDGFGSLERVDWEGDKEKASYWFATACRGGRGEVVEVTGKTPEESVAKLYLELNKKQK